MAQAGTARAAILDRANGSLKRVPVFPLYVLALAPGVYEFYLAVQGLSGPDP